MNLKKCVLIKNPRQIHHTNYIIHDDIKNFGEEINEDNFDKFMSNVKDLNIVNRLIALNIINLFIQKYDIGDKVIFNKVKFDVFGIIPNSIGVIKNCFIKNEKIYYKVYFENSKYTSYDLNEESLSLVDEIKKTIKPTYKMYNDIIGFNMNDIIQCLGKPKDIGLNWDFYDISEEYIEKLVKRFGIFQIISEDPNDDEYDLRTFMNYLKETNKDLIKLLIDDKIIKEV